MPPSQFSRDLQEAQLRTACQEALEEVLETMFFELPVEGLHFSAPPLDDELLALARFSGSLSGTLAVSASNSILGPLAAGFLGLELEELTTDQHALMLTEIANMLCGATMSRIEPEGRLMIEQPFILSGEERAAALAQGPWLRFPMEAGHLLVCARCAEV